MKVGESALRKVLSDWQATRHIRVNKTGEVPDLRQLTVYLRRKSIKKKCKHLGNISVQNVTKTEYPQQIPQMTFT